MIPQKHTKTAISSKVEPLTINEYKLLLKHAKPTYRLIYMIAANMGLRQTEIIYIDIDDIDFINKTLSYRVQKTKVDTVTTKSIPERLFQEIKEYIEKYQLKTGDPLFKVQKGKYKGKRITSKTIGKKTKELYLKLGIGHERKKRTILSKKNPVKGASLHNKNFHSLRHLYGTEIFNITENMEVTAYSLRHSRGNLETVRRTYVNLHNLAREAKLQNQISEILFETGKI